LKTKVQPFHAIRVKMSGGDEMKDEYLEKLKEAYSDASELITGGNYGDNAARAVLAVELFRARIKNEDEKEEG